MSEPLKTALRDYNDAMRMFNYATSSSEIDVAIMLIHSADIKIKALKYITSDICKFEPISEVY